MTRNELSASTFSSGLVRPLAAIVVLVASAGRHSRISHRARLALAPCGPSETDGDRSERREDAPDAAAGSRKRSIGRTDNGTAGARRQASDDMRHATCNNPRVENGSGQSKKDKDTPIEA